MTEIAFRIQLSKRNTFQVRTLRSETSISTFAISKHED